MSFFCLCPICNGKEVSRTTWDKHSMYLTQEPIVSQVKEKKCRRDNLDIDHELRISASQQVITTSSSALIQDTGVTPSTLNVQGTAESTDLYEFEQLSSFDNGKGSSREIYEQYFSDDDTVSETNTDDQEETLEQLGLRDDISLAS